MALVALVVIAIATLLVALTLDRATREDTPEVLRACAIVLIAPLSLSTPPLTVGAISLPILSTAVFCPLLAILIVMYCLHGPRAARLTVVVCVAVRVVLMVFRLAFFSLTRGAAPPAARETLASAAALVVDVTVAAAIFQALARARAMPLGVAAGIALVVGELCDVVLFPVLWFGSLHASAHAWTTGHLAAAAPMLALGPIVGLYVNFVLHPAAVRRLRNGRPFDFLLPPKQQPRSPFVDPRAVLVADERGRIVHASPGLRALLGLREGEEPRDLRELGAWSGERAFANDGRGTATVRTRLGSLRVKAFTTSVKVGERSLASTVLAPAEENDESASPTLRSLAMTGFAASGVAHDLANLVQALDPLIDEATSQSDERARVMLKDVVARITQLTKCLRDLGRTSERALETIELASFAKRVLAPFAEKLPGGTKLAIADGVAVTTVADPVELDRILVNLVLSAAQAARGGEVQVEIGGDDQIASISVRDRAKPIDDVGELMRRTEGIELSVVAAATRDIGGLLHIDSREGEGTTIRVELPRV